MKHSFFTRPALSLLLACGLALSALGADPAPALDPVYCFSAEALQAQDCNGVLLTEVPESALGTLMLGTRQLQPGDVVTREQIPSIALVPGEDSGTAEIAVLCLSDSGVTESRLTIPVSGRKNQPPLAEDSTFQTYKNIPGPIALSVSDPEGDDLTVTIVESPKRGTAEVREDGTVLYTPSENKVGKDRFTFTATDTAGNVSEEATVRITILKPSDKRTFGDMDGDPALLAATWLREEGIYTGYTVSGQLLFGPEQTLTRGEFLAMCAGLVGMEEAEEILSTGFADDTAEWLRPYVTTALYRGYLTGIAGEDGLTLAADSPITQAQAAKLVSGLLGLSEPPEPVMGMNTDVPAWASGAVSAISEAGICTITDPEAPLTHRDAAMLLYGAWQYGQARQAETSLLSWAAR